MPLGLAQVPSLPGAARMADVWMAAAWIAVGWIAVVLAALLLPMATASAATCTATITSPITFNSLDLLSGTAADGQGTLTITCVTTVLDAGTLGSLPTCPGINAGSGGAVSGNRKLANGANLLTYQLYQDAARTVPWGSATDATLGTVPRVNVPVTIPVFGTGGGSISVTVYARLFGSQTTAPVGTYSSAFLGAQTAVQYGTLTLPVVGGCATLQGLLSATTTAPFTVQTDVAKNCLVTTQSLSFGTHGVLVAAVDGTGQVRVTCTNPTPYSVGLETGAFTATTRRMTNGGAFVVYGLYQNTGRSIPWGTAVGETVSGTGTGLTQMLMVYGRVLPQPTPAAATYVDNVAVTITY